MTPEGARLLRDPLFAPLKASAIACTGMTYWQDKDESLADTVARLLEQRGLTPAQMMSRLTAEGGAGAETDTLIDAVTVGETFFFRNSAQFAIIEHHILPDIIARNRSRRQLAVWCAGCSNGAEPYSLAILLDRAFGVSLADWDIHILATDISRGALAEAQAGSYSDWSVRDLPRDIRDQCFTAQGARWRLRDRYRKGVHFVRHNMVTDPLPLPPWGHYDVVVCRNVLMYFDAITRDRVLASFHGILADGGWLVVSAAEAGAQIAAHFATIALPTGTLYRKPLLKAVKPATVAPVSALAIQVRSLLDLGEFSDAAQMCRTWCATMPLDPAAYYFLGLALEPFSEDQAMAAFRRALFLAPHMALAHFNLMRLLLRRGDRVVARRHYLAIMADLAGLPPDQKLPQASDLTVGELSAIVRCLGEAS